MVITKKKKKSLHSTVSRRLYGLENFEKRRCNWVYILAV